MRPSFKGLLSMYLRQPSAFSGVMICTSLKLRVQTSTFDFNRKEKLPLMNCIAFSSETFGEGVSIRVKVIRHDHEGVELEFSLGAIIENCLLE